MRKYTIAFFTVCLSTTLIGCNSIPTRIISSTNQVVTPIPALPPLELERFEFEWPRDSNGAIIANSNLFIGLNQENWEKLMRNLARYAARERLYQQRINTANQLRREINNAINPNGTDGSTQPTNGTSTQAPGNVSAVRSRTRTASR